jgi:hypothetical protein
MGQPLEFMQQLRGNNGNKKVSSGKFMKYSARSDDGLLTPEQVAAKQATAAWWRSWR